ncbi:MAG: M48 family metallopeptidase [Dokdonella sp.]|uniref:M48 family metallopeptidase n=1 Tax=Dokdonella sp. TaxID=2291710 RepID=UPI0025C695B5|nr:M48 family metallopeptidase [Dokdonella sp.]MBZ0223522.1 M48 family metallopeptidase [Dokdonella sp.]
MNFFAHQEQARRQTRRMLFMFALAVLAVVVATDFAIVLALGRREVDLSDLIVLSLCVAGVIGLGSSYRISRLRGGGAAVAASLGAVHVPADTGNFAYRRLRNVIEEMAIASGVPVPEIFVLEQEAGINAFAAGHAPTDAAITVTRGALDKLTRAELQGVIGHEFSHVLNGDMRLNIRLMGAVFGILVIATVGRILARSSSRGRGRGAGMIVLVGATLWAVGYIGVVLARVIKASISRQREFLADASSVQFTRQTEGIADALKKVGALAEGSRLGNVETEEVAHMLFGDGVGFGAVYATHPPIVERIRRLDPSFKAEEFKAIAAAWADPVVSVDDEEREDVSIAGFAPAGRSGGSTSRVDAGIPDAGTRIPISPRAVAAQVGQPGADDHCAAHDLRNSIPIALRHAAGQAEKAMPLVLALLFDQDSALRVVQIERVRSQLGAAQATLAAGFAPQLLQLHPMQRLPLAALAFPALRRQPRPQLQRFMAALRALIEADARVSLSEYCLATLIRIQVIEALDPAASWVMGRTRLPGVAADLKNVLAIVARHGHDDAEAARKAYALALNEVLPGSPILFEPPQAWTAALDRALPRLDRLAPAGKELVVQALTCAISADGMVDVAEAELLRMICAALHCPLPPQLQDRA